MFNSKVLVLIGLIVVLSILDIVAEAIQFIPILGDILGIISEIGFEIIQLILVAMIPFAVKKG